MSAVNLTNVSVLDNPAPFLTPFQFEISYECVAPLKDAAAALDYGGSAMWKGKFYVYAADVRLDLTMRNARLDLAIAAKGGSFIHCHSEYLEWKLIYVGSAEDETYDQLLESVLVGPVNIGNYRFVLQADPPDPSKIREEDIIGVTVLLLTCSYLNQEFVRVGYYVNNDYDEEQLREEPPQKVLIDRVQRNILSDKPRVTKFPINFHPENNESSEQIPPPDHVTGAEGNEEELPCFTENHTND